MSNRIIESLITFADEFPDTIALVGENESLTYKEMLLRALSIADWFDQVRISRIGLYRENSIEWIIIDLAALIAEVTLVPIPSFFSNQQIRDLIDEAGLDFIFCDDIKRFRKIDRRFLNEGMTIAQTAVLWSPSPINETATEWKSAAKITFTPGTGGELKGVCSSQDAIEKTTFSVASRLSKLSISKHINLMHFSALLENIVGVYVPLIMGKQIHVYSGESLGLPGRSGFDIYQLIEKLNQVKPDSLILLPQVLIALVSAVEMNGPLNHTFSFMGLSSGKIPPTLIRKARSFGWPIYQEYDGPECTSLVALNASFDERVDHLGKSLTHIQGKIQDNTIFPNKKSFSHYPDDTSSDDGRLLRVPRQGLIPEHYLAQLDGLPQENQASR